MTGRRVVQSSVSARVAAAAAGMVLAVGADCVQPADTRPAESQPALGAPIHVGRIQAAGVTESSGIAASRRQAGVYWTITDSGGPASLFAMDQRGADLGEVRLSGAANVDWEDIAADSDGTLYVADVGDNQRARTELAIYVVPEPPAKVARAAVARKVRFRYAAGQGPTDCEALFVRKGWAYLVSKEFLQARLFRVPLDGAGDEAVQAEYLGLLPAAGWVTAADISADGKHLAVLSYTAVYVFDLPRPIEELLAVGTGVGSRPAQAFRAQPRKRLINLRQAEGIGWAPGLPVGDLLITNEQRDIYRVRAAGPAAE